MASLSDITARLRERAAPGGSPRRQALLGERPYDIADRYASETAAWQPRLGMTDQDWGPDRDEAVARIRDLVRNDGWAAGVVMRVVDSVVGPDFRFSSRPDYRALSRIYGSRFDRVWAREYAQALEAYYRVWAYDHGLWCDASRRHNLPQLFRLAYRHAVRDGDAPAALLWRPENVGPGRASFATTVQLINPDRLSNPMHGPDTQTRRRGVELDEDGAPIGYHFQAAHPADETATTNLMLWNYLAREDQWGRPQVAHYFDAEDADQVRGAGGILTAVALRLRMIGRFDQEKLRAAVKEAIFHAFIKSNNPDAMDGFESEGGPMSYEERLAIRKERPTRMGDAVIPMLFDGESIETVSPGHPSGNEGDFVNGGLRGVAAGTGTFAPAIHNDWSEINLSSGRLGQNIELRTILARRHGFATRFCQPIISAFAEEVHDAGLLPLPSGAPDFYEARGLYAKARFLGPGRGWVDTQKEADGAASKLANGFDTLEGVLEDMGGLDLDDVLDARAAAIEAFAERGLPLPIWARGEAPKAAPDPQPPAPEGSR